MTPISPAFFGHNSKSNRRGARVRDRENRDPTMCSNKRAAKSWKEIVNFVLIKCGKSAFPSAIKCAAFSRLLVF